jgi:quercetin dioxygenase-like cupin family protein
MVTIGKKNAVPPRTYDDAPSVRGVEKRVLIGPRQGAPRFVMRHFTLAPGGYSPEHTHPWEHEVYVLSGKGRVRFSDGAVEVGPDDFVFVPPMDKHQFLNAGDEPLEFLCVVPLSGDDG